MSGFVRLRAPAAISASPPGMGSMAVTARVARGHTRSGTDRTRAMSARRRQSEDASRDRLMSSVCRRPSRAARRRWQPFRARASALLLLPRRAVARRMERAGAACAPPSEPPGRTSARAMCAPVIARTDLGRVRAGRRRHEPQRARSAGGDLSSSGLITRAPVQTAPGINGEPQPLRSVLRQPASRAGVLIACCERHGRSLSCLDGEPRKEEGYASRAHRVETKPPKRWITPVGNAFTNPAGRTSSSSLPPRDAQCAVGGFRAGAENSGRRASATSDTTPIRTLV